MMTRARACARVGGICDSDQCRNQLGPGTRACRICAPCRRPRARAHACQHRQRCSRSMRTHALVHACTNTRMCVCLHVSYTRACARTHTHTSTHTHIHIRSQHFLPPACARGSERQRRRGCKHGGNTPPAPVDREHTRRTQQARSGGRVPGVQHWRLKLCYLYRAVIMRVLASG